MGKKSPSVGATAHSAVRGTIERQYMGPNTGTVRGTIERQYMGSGAAKSPAASNATGNVTGTLERINMGTPTPKVSGVKPASGGTERLQDISRPVVDASAAKVKYAQGSNTANGSTTRVQNNAAVSSTSSAFTQLNKKTVSNESDAQTQLNNVPVSNTNSAACVQNKKPASSESNTPTQTNTKPVSSVSTMPTQTNTAPIGNTSSTSCLQSNAPVQLNNQPVSNTTINNTVTPLANVAAVTGAAAVMPDINTNAAGVDVLVNLQGGANAPQVQTPAQVNTNALTGVDVLVDMNSGTVSNLNTQTPVTQGSTFALLNSTPVMQNSTATMNTISGTDVTPVASVNSVAGCISWDLGVLEQNIADLERATADLQNAENAYIQLRERVAASWQSEAASVFLNEMCFDIADYKHLVSNISTLTAALKSVQNIYSGCETEVVRNMTILESQLEALDGIQK